MFAAKNRESIGAIYVCQQDFENNDSSVWFAAVQMRYYLSRITSAPFEIVVDDNGDGIYIRFDDTYGDDEFWLKTEGNKLFITGGKRGVLYGVYDFLETLGCRFFTPECEKIPTIINLQIPYIYKFPIFTNSLY